jgi:L-ascorbate metabolism protein UlaG (beta-lactamase superfamily)
VELTTFGHSCLRLTVSDRRIVIDPGTFADAQGALQGAEAVLITHEHPDHLDHDALGQALERDPRLQVWAPAGAKRTFDQRLQERVTEVLPHQQLEVAGVRVRTFGGQHALIHRSIPVIDNLGYLVEDVLYHPGDAFDVPDVAVEWLAVPTHGPWSKLAEVLDFVTANRAQRAFQIHDGLLNDIGRANAQGHLTRVAKQYGTRYEYLPTGSTLTL